jgi:hypothetical protein
MRRQIFVHLLFAWLLLAASALGHNTANVQAIQPGVYSYHTIACTIFVFCTSLRTILIERVSGVQQQQI